MFSGKYRSQTQQQPFLIPLWSVWQDKSNTLRSCQMCILYCVYRAASLSVLRLSILSLLSSTPHRQKLISPDICFQSKASSLLFPLCRPAIKRINPYAGADHKRISPLSAFCRQLDCLSFLLAVSVPLPVCLPLSFNKVNLAQRLKMPKKKPKRRLAVCFYQV